MNDGCPECAQDLHDRRARSVAARRPADVPPPRLIRPESPTGKVPAVQGESFEELVPDTCDLEESARLFLEHFLTEVTVTDPEYYHEPFNRGFLMAIPPRLTLDIGSYLCGLPKYREALPLLRIMTGSRKGLEIDQAWAAHLLKSIGPDGLWYITRIGRPWDDNIGSIPDQSAYWFPVAPETEFYTHLTMGNGRLLGSLAVFYQMTGDEIWNQTARGVVDRLNELVIRVDKLAFFPKFNWLPNERLTPEEIKNAIADMRNQTVGETDKNTAMWQAWIITGLAQYYRVSGYEPARELARGLVNFIRDTRYLEEWKSHFHCTTAVIHSMLELALATGDQELAQYARQFYEYAKGGKDTIALPQIGYFFNGQGADKGMEGCSIADMTTLAIKMARAGMGDQYWEDADRYIRNCLIGIQRTRPDHLSSILRQLAEIGTADFGQGNELKEVPVKYYELADHTAERIVGSYSCHFFPNDLFTSPYFDSCCQGNIARSIYYAWENILTREGDTLSVNLLLNRTSAWADIHSYIPYTGRVEIRIKQACDALKIRMNDWIEKDQVRVTNEGKPAGFEWQGRSIKLGGVAAGQRVTVSFPIAERTEKLDSFGHAYTAVFKGNDCVDISPRGKYLTLFQRDHYRFDNPRYIQVRRFVCSNPLEY